MTPGEKQKAVMYATAALAAVGPGARPGDINVLGMKAEELAGVKFLPVFDWEDCAHVRSSLVSFVVSIIEKEPDA